MLAHPEVLIAVAAFGPPLVYMLVLSRLTAATGPSWTSNLIAFLWGLLVAANVALVLNDRAAAALALEIGTARTQRIVGWGVGPLIEEILKAGGFVALGVAAPRSLSGPRAGALQGALIGLGFAAVENLGYYRLAAVQGGWAGLGRAVFLRGLVEGANHAIFTAISGMAIGWAVTSGRWSTASIGLVAAVAVHATWNAVTSPAIVHVLCNPPAAGAACAPAPDAIDLFVTAPVLVLVSMGPVAVALAALVRHAPRASRR